MQPELFDHEAAAEVAGYAHVAPEQGVDTGDHGLTYAIPRRLAPLRVGDRVAIPLGRGDRKTLGFVVGLSDEPEVAPSRVKPILSRDPHHVSLTEDLVELAKWMARYYCCPLGMVFGTMLPAAVKKGTGSVVRTFVRLPAEPKETEENARKPSKLQQKLLDALAEHADGGEPWVEAQALALGCGAKSANPVRTLAERGLIETRRQVVVEAPRSGEPPAVQLTRPKQLSDDQRRVLADIEPHLRGGFSVHLLHGVTGSGKTEVYLRLIEALRVAHADRAAAPGVAVLVPEIALTPQTIGRFVGRFEGVAVLHSGLTAAQRHEQWRKIRSGEARIVVGARSAVFAAMEGLSLIIVDEEHDSSYKQDQLPRYNGRDVAIKRAQMLGIPVVLGSATPSLESWWRCAPPDVLPTEDDAPPPQSASNTYHLHRLPTRVGGAVMPKVELVDLAQERRRQGVHLLGARLEEMVRQTLRDAGQVMLLLNRRGYANYIACADHRCGWQMFCDYCDAMMVYHKDKALPAGGVLRCHHCQAEQLLPERCPTCSKKVVVFGLGTQRVEEELAKKFPDAKQLRMDSDVMRRGRDYQDSLESFRQGHVDILLGTQMIAKGLDFPAVRLVGVIVADTALHMPDFRASERTFQLVAQVAGRSGRGDRPGRVVVQTFCPDDVAIGYASKHDFEGFARHELAVRQEVGLPPVGRMARIVCRDMENQAAVAHAKELFEHLEIANARLGGHVRIMGPTPCAVARVAGYFRHQIEMLAPRAGLIQQLLADLRAKRLLISDARTAVDVDPVSLL